LRNIQCPGKFTNSFHDAPKILCSYIINRKEEKPTINIQPEAEAEKVVFVPEKPNQIL
jgi:hypothetical protein